MSFCMVSLDALKDVELMGCEKVRIKVPAPAVMSRVKLLRDGGMKFAVMLRAWTALLDGMALMATPEASKIPPAGRTMNVVDGSCPRGGIARMF